jgi:hypothetical protein
MTTTIASKLSGHYDIIGIANHHADALDHRVNEVDHLVPNKDGSMDATGHSDLICLDCTVVTEDDGTALAYGIYRVVEDSENGVFRLQSQDIEGTWTIGLDYGSVGGLDIRQDFYRLCAKK